MRKFLATILAVLYLATSTGATVTLHYCMGKLSSVNMVHKDACDKCGMKKAKGCCEDKVKVIKVQDSHQSANQAIAFQLTEAALQNNFAFLASGLPSVGYKVILHNNSPPGNLSIPLYLLHCHFSI